jgi:hypothetical protein
MHLEVRIWFHNSPRASSVYTTAQNYTPYKNVLISNILQSTKFCYLNRKL